MMTGTVGRLNTQLTELLTHFPTHAFTGMVTLSERCHLQEMGNYRQPIASNDLRTLPVNRAFVKEADGDDVVEPLYERQHSDLPNYITPEGLLHLKNRIRILENSIDVLSKTDSLEKKSQIARAQHDLRYLLERVHRAQAVTTPASPKKVQFGVTAVLEDEKGQSYSFTLVGEDETDIDQGRISWATPIGKQLSGRVIGDHIAWSRGDEQIQLELVDIFS